MPPTFIYASKDVFNPFENIANLILLAEDNAEGSKETAEVLLTAAKNLLDGELSQLTALTATNELAHLDEQDETNHFRLMYKMVENAIRFRDKKTHPDMMKGCLEAARRIIEVTLNPPKGAISGEEADRAFEFLQKRINKGI